MKKSLHFSILCALMCLFHLPTMAQDVVIDFTQETIQGGATTNFTHEVNGYTFAATKENGYSFPAQNKTNKDIRLYARNKLVISSATSFNQIVFQVSTYGKRQWAEFTPTLGTATVDRAAGTVTWTSPQPLNSIEFAVSEKNTYGTGTNQTGHFCFTTVTITPTNSNTEIVQSPTFSKVTGNYFEAFNLELSAPEGYQIYYTLDLSIPNNTKTPYTTAIPISQTTVVKAIAYNAAGNPSFEVTHTYTFPALRANIKEMKMLEPKAIGKLTLDNATVLAAGNGRLFVADQTGGILFYNTDLNYAPGTVLNGSVIGMYDLYNGLPEIVKAGNDTNGSQITTSEGGTVTGREITFAELENPDNLCTLVKISGVTLDSIEGKLYAIQGDKRFEVYNNTLKAIPTGTKLVKGSTDNTITAIVSIYNNAYQLLPTTTEGLQLVTTGIESAVVKEETTGKNVLYNLAGQRVNADYKGVVIKNGKKYIQK